MATLTKDYCAILRLFAKYRAITVAIRLIVTEVITDIPTSARRRCLSRGNSLQRVMTTSYTFLPVSVAFMNTLGSGISRGETCSSIQISVVGSIVSVTLMVGWLILCVLLYQLISLRQNYPFPSIVITIPKWPHEEIAIS